MTVTRLDPQHWDGTRWNSHSAFKTIAHHHVSCYSSAAGHDDCDIMIVNCADGRWYIEDTWGGDAKGAADAWNPFDPSNVGPLFFPSMETAQARATAIVAEVCGVPESRVSII